MKKCKNIFLLAGLALFWSVGCGNHGEEKPANQEQKPQDGQTDKDKDKDKDAQSDAKSDDDQQTCKAGHFGAECKPCDCRHGTCKDGKEGTGDCSSCEEGYFGKNCDNNVIDCRHGTPSLGPSGNGKCASCEKGWDIAQNCADTTSDYMADTQGNVYKVIVIDGSTWMAENMATDQATDGTAVTCDANTDPVDGDTDFVAKYGCLYNWADAQKVCPKGWHLPQKADFEGLLSAAESNDNDPIPNPAWLALVAKDVAWKNVMFLGMVTNSTGFSALPAAGKIDGSYINFGMIALFWSATEYENNSKAAYYLDLAATGYAVLDFYLKDYSLSVRCVKD